ncbi:MAG: ABC-type transporter, integral rane subunit [Paenibacillaceae bacterium]|jgi:iron complex transport system permease protein|nr:ABC-type transporter, integral rane subunit [Paenibacillaceae bacterium]
MNSETEFVKRAAAKEASRVPMWAVVGGGTLLLVLTMVYSMTKGASSAPFPQVLEALFHYDAGNRVHLVVADLRLPRIIASALVGAAFAVAGALMQGATRNPLADSGLLGLNGGACFALSIGYAFFPGLGFSRMMLLSFAGAAGGAGLVGGVASMRRGGATPMRLVLAGASVSALLTALSQGIALYFDVAQDIMFWTAGGVAGSNWEQLRIMLPWIAGGVAGAILLSPSVSLLSLGEDVARGLGLNAPAIRLLCHVFVLVLAGAAVSVVGAVGFVGLVVPHFARFLVGVDYRRIIPAAAVLGAWLVVGADLGARTLNPPFEAPLGALISLLGVPFFLYLANKQRKVSP